jgi:hypothetical protein
MNQLSAIVVLMNLMHHALDFHRRNIMTVCPIAIAVGCKKCPAFSVCPLKETLGDYKKPDAAEEKAAAAKAKSSAKK